MDREQRLEIAGLIRTFIASHSMSRAGFAAKAGVSLSSVNHLLLGDFTDKLLDRIEAQLGVKFRTQTIVSQMASADLGAYTFQEVQRYVGFFELARQDFQASDRINVFAMEIVWSEVHKGLVLKHRGIPDSEFKQTARISFPSGQRFIFLLSSEGGWHQTAIIERMDYRRLMRGIMLTVAQEQDLSFVPMLSPFVLIGRRGGEGVSRGVLSGSDQYERYRRYVDWASEFAWRWMAQSNHTRADAQRGGTS